MIVDKFVVDKEMMDEIIIFMIFVQERQEIVNKIELNLDGCFFCRYFGCLKFFKYNGKSRKRYEFSYDFLVDVFDNCDFIFILV